MHLLSAGVKEVKLIMANLKASLFTQLAVSAWILFMGLAGATPSYAQTCPGFNIEGFGKNTTGGCGGPTTFVTSLANSGPGTLREALTLSRPRIIKFAVSGTIELTQDLGIKGSNLTIDSSDAPNGGIAIRGGTITINTGGNIIVRHIRVRPGPNLPNPGSGDGIRIGGNLTVSNVVLDHVSVSWSTDELVSVTSGASNVTIQWSILSEGLHNSAHPEQGHSFGLFIDVNANNVTAHHNLLVHSSERLPAVAQYIAGTYTVEWVNNVVYNPSFGGVTTAIGRAGATTNPTLQIDSIGNFYKCGANTKFCTTSSNYPSHRGFGSPAPRFWVFGNIDWVRTDDSMPQDKVMGNPKQSKHVVVGSPHISPAQVTATDAFTARVQVLAQAGATSPCRDSVDSRIVNDAINGTGAWIDSPTEVGGWPDLLESCGAPTTPNAPTNLQVAP